MQSNNLWGTPRPAGVRWGLVVRLVLALLATVGSIALAWTLLSPNRNARASSITEVNTMMQPWSDLIDHAGTHVWVAEPGCAPTPVCQAAFPGVIGEFNIVTSGTATPVPGETDFKEPTTDNKGNKFSGPAFLAEDSKGNIWFTEPTTGAIGELTPGTTPVWNQWSTGATSAPRDLVIDKNDNIWFTDHAANSIGFFDTKLHKTVQNKLKTANSDPYGIIIDNAGTIWFTENGNSQLGMFTPNSTGIVSISEFAINSPTFGHMLVYDSAGKNLWYSEGASSLAIGEFSLISKKVVQDFSVTSAVCGTSSGCSTTIDGIGIDSNGKIWFDDQQNKHVGYLDPSTGNISVTTLTSNPFDGLVVDSSDNAWVTENGAKLLAEVPLSALVPPTPTATSTASGSPTPTGSVTPAPSPSPTIGNAPVNKTWYFAEGKVGAGFTEYITIENPDPSNACTVDLQYLLGAGINLVRKTMTIQPVTRGTTWVNQDLNMPASSTSYDAVSTIVQVDPNDTSCKGVVAERPIYFTNFTNVSSGDDVVGFTKTGTDFYFADVPMGGGYSSYITILNQNAAVANVTATFYAGGQVLQTLTQAVQPNTRGTIIPTNSGTTVVHAAVHVHSDQQVMVERPSYFDNINGDNAGVVSGAASVIGVQKDNTDWLFAEGYTGTGFQEDLVLSNFGTSLANAKVTLEYSNGSTQEITYQVQPNAQTFVDVNWLRSTGTGTCTPSPCQPTLDVSAKVTSDNPIVAQREMYFHYSDHGTAATGVSDVTGLVAPAAPAYTFAEGYTNAGYNEWLTLQNPTKAPETIDVTLINVDGRSYAFEVPTAAQSRTTINITSIVATNLIQPNDTYLGYEVSMIVQSAAGGLFVAERPMYWNTYSSTNPNGTQGGSAVFGYTGG